MLSGKTLNLSKHPLGHIKHKCMMIGDGSQGSNRFYLVERQNSPEPLLGRGMWRGKLEYLILLDCVYVFASLTKFHSRGSLMTHAC